MIACCKNKICYVTGFKMPGVERMVCCDGSLVVGCINDVDDGVAFFCLRNAAANRWVQNFAAVLQIPGGPYHKIFWNGYVRIKVAEVVVKLQAAVVRMTVPSINVIVNGNARKEVSN